MSAIQFDKHGVPAYAAEPEQLEEYTARAWDIFYGRAGNSALQSTTPIHLRAGCRGQVYDAVKSIPHADLITKIETPATEDTPATTTVTLAGMELFLKAVTDAIEPEKAVAETDEFETDE